MDVPRIKKESTSPLPESLQRMRELFPQFVKENTIDFDALKAFFDEKGAIAGQEKYGLSWAGKSDAFRAIRVPATGTLVPQEKESKDWDNTENLFIEGDNLEVLKLLQKHYREKIKLIYIDPPYNTGKDFIYKDNFTENVSDYYERTGQSKDGVKLTSNLETNGRYHSDWLTMMYPRLFLARNLLKDDGVIFISIDDNEVANLRLIMDEIFGEENFVASIVWQKKYGPANDAKFFSETHEYLILYAKHKESWLPRLYDRTKNQLEAFKNPDNDLRGPWRASDLSARTKSESCVYPITLPSGREVMPPASRSWIVSKEKYNQLVRDNRIWFGVEGNGRPMQKKFLSEVKEGITPQTWWGRDFAGDNKIARYEMKEIFPENVFDTPKPTSLIKRVLEVSTSDSDLTLDFFAGSGTAAHAVMGLNAEDGGKRKWICVQIPEELDENTEAKKAGFNTIAEISRERIRRVGDRIMEGHHKMERFEMVNGELIHSDISKNKNLDIGFKSFKLSQSNYRQWSVLTDKDDEQKIKEQMRLFVEKPLVDGAEEESVVYEILIKEGFGLNSMVEKKKVGEIEVWSIADGEKKMVVSFAHKLDRENIDSLELSENDTFVCFDAALNDTEKVNLMKTFSVRVI